MNAATLITAPKVDTMPTIPGYQLVHWTQHWSLIDGAWYRDALAVRASDGAPRRIAVLEAS